MALEVQHTGDPTSLRNEEQDGPRFLQDRFNLITWKEYVREVGGIVASYKENLSEIENPEIRKEMTSHIQALKESIATSYPLVENTFNAGSTGVAVEFANLSYDSFENSLNELRKISLKSLNAPVTAEYRPIPESAFDIVLSKLHGWAQNIGIAESDAERQSINAAKAIIELAAKEEGMTLAEFKANFGFGQNPRDLVCFGTWAIDIISTLSSTADYMLDSPTAAKVALAADDFGRFLEPNNPGPMCTRAKLIGNVGSTLVGGGTVLPKIASSLTSKYPWLLATPEKAMQALAAAGLGVDISATIAFLPAEGATEEYRASINGGVNPETARERANNYYWKTVQGYLNTTEDWYNYLKNETLKEISDSIGSYF